MKMGVCKVPVFSDKEISHWVRSPPTLLLKKRAPKAGGYSRGCRGDRRSREYRANIVSLARLTGLTRLAGITGLTELTEPTVLKLKMV